MQVISVLDTSISTDNLGDEIIMDSVYDVLSEVAPNAYLYKIATHDYMGAVSRSLVGKSELAIVGGTNLLDSKILSRNALWKLRFADALSLRSVLLLGVGWRGYMGAVNHVTRSLLRRMLVRDLVHSVRDSYAATKLEPVLSNVSNTACMTMWRLTPEWCANLPRARAANAVTTLTFYHGDPSADRQMLELLVARYSRVHFWPQQAQDLRYFESLGVRGINQIRPSTRAYNQFLENNDVDFIGTRLHGGIRAMQKGHRALIVQIDNRAAEIARDTNLSVVSRANIDSVEEWICGSAATEIKLPIEAIGAWKTQMLNRF